MSIMTAKQYEESLRKLNLVVYMFGKQVENVVDDPIIRPSMKAVAETYTAAHRPEYEDIMTATSHISGKGLTVLTTFTKALRILSKKAKWVGCWDGKQGAAFSGA